METELHKGLFRGNQLYNSKTKKYVKGSNISRETKAESRQAASPYSFGLRIDLNKLWCGGCG